MGGRQDESQVSAAQQGRQVADAAVDQEVGESTVVGHVVPICQKTTQQCRDARSAAAPMHSSGANAQQQAPRHASWQRMAPAWRYPLLGLTKHLDSDVFEVGRGQQRAEAKGESAAPLQHNREVLQWWGRGRLSASRQG